MHYHASAPRLLRLLSSCPLMAIAAVVAVLPNYSLAFADDDITPGTGFGVGDGLSNGNYELRLNTNGTLVLYWRDIAIWSTKTYNAGIDYVYLNLSGELSVRNKQSGQVYWKTNTADEGVTKAQLRSNGDIVVANATSLYELDDSVTTKDFWQSKTASPQYQPPSAQMNYAQKGGTMEVFYSSSLSTDQEQGSREAVGLQHNETNLGFNEIDNTEVKPLSTDLTSLKSDVDNSGTSLAKAYARTTCMRLVPATTGECDARRVYFSS